MKFVLLWAMTLGCLACKADPPVIEHDSGSSYGNDTGSTVPVIDVGVPAKKPDTATSRLSPKVDCTENDKPPLWLGNNCIIDSACSNACQTFGLCRRMAPNTPQECTYGCRNDSDCPTGYNCRLDMCNLQGETLKVCMRPVATHPDTCSIHDDCGQCSQNAYCVPALNNPNVKLCRDTCTGSCPEGYVCAKTGFEGIPAGVTICRPTG